VRDPVQTLSEKPNRSGQSSISAERVLEGVVRACSPPRSGNGISYIKRGVSAVAPRTIFEPRCNAQLLRRPTEARISSAQF